MRVEEVVNDELTTFFDGKKTGAMVQFKQV